MKSKLILLTLLGIMVLGPVRAVGMTDLPPEVIVKIAEYPV